MERTWLANERALLAYLRTALMGGALLLAKLIEGAPALAGGVAMVIAGVGMLAFGIVGFRRVRRRLADSGAPERASTAARDPQ